MGGGDLNLKKSWHPNTMKNMERVWKAEQKDSEEKKRIAELQKELNAERDLEEMQKLGQESGVMKKKDDVKLEWMYKGPSQSVNHEEYLLGKSIDKNFEKYNDQQRSGPSTSQDEESLPAALRQAKSSIFSEQVDVARKLHEDPLMAIRQRAVEKAKELYNNPVRMKKIQQMVAEKSALSKKHKEKKKKKKSKKASKRDDERMLDALLTEKLKNALKDRDLLRKLKKANRRVSSSSSESSRDMDSHNDRADSSSDHEKEAKYSNVACLRGSSQRHHSPEESKNVKRYQNYHDKQSRSPKSYHSRSSLGDSFRKRSRSRSGERNHDYRKYPGSRSEKMAMRTQEETGFQSEKRRNSPSRKRSKSRSKDRSKSSYQKKQHEMKIGKNSRSPSPQGKDQKKQQRLLQSKKSYRGRSASSSDEYQREHDPHKHIRVQDAPRDSSDDSDQCDKSSLKRSFGLMMADGSKPVKRDPPVVNQNKPSVPQQKPVVLHRKEKNKLSEEEKERKRQEMLENAAWRDKEREQYVKRYRKEEDDEKKQLHENFDDDFARKQFSKAADQSSVEGRIKSKLNTIQRSKVAMDQHFARR